MKTQQEQLQLSIVTPTLEGGVGRVVLNLAQVLLQQGISLELVTLSLDERHAMDLPDGLRVVSLRKTRMSKALFAIRRYLREKRPDHVLSVSFHTNVSVLLASVGLHVKVHASEHIAIRSALRSLSFMKRSVMRSLIRLLYPRATSVIAVSDAAAEQLRELVPVAGERITSVVNPVLTDDLIKGGKQSPTHKWFTDDYQVVMGLGRLTAQKDFETLVRAFAQAQRPENARLVIFGEGEDRTQLEDLVFDLGLSDLVDLPGYTNEPYAHLANASLFVLSSAWEGLPTVLIEALALGCPVVSTDCPTGPSEILQNGRYGVLVPVGDVDVLSREMSAFFSGERHEVPDSDVLKQYTPAVVAEAYWQFMTR